MSELTFQPCIKENHDLYNRVYEVKDKEEINQLNSQLERLLKLSEVLMFYNQNYKEETK